MGIVSSKRKQYSNGHLVSDAVPAETRLQALEFEIDGAEQLRMPGCVSIADCHEHENSAEVALVKFHTLILPKLSEKHTG